MTAEIGPTASFQEYLEGEQHSERRHEWVAGRMYALAGGTERHDLMAGLVYETLAPRARQRSCRPFVQNRRVRLGLCSYLPDLLVVCPSDRAPERLYEVDLTLVVEVLSPSTETTDRREKAPVYAGAPSFQAYALLDPDRRRVELAVPGREALLWEVYGPGDLVPHLDVDVLYGLLDSTAVT